MPELPEPGESAYPSKDDPDERLYFTAAQMLAIRDSGIRYGMERAAVIAETMQDTTEAARADEAARQSTINREPTSAQLSRYKHLQTVQLWNKALSNAASAIRAALQE
jgi:hypothetical protein